MAGMLDVIRMPPQRRSAPRDGAPDRDDRRWTMRTSRLRSLVTSLSLASLLSSMLLAGTAPTDAAGRWETTHRITRQTVPLDVCCAAAVAWSPEGDLLAIGAGASLRLLRGD